MKTCNKISPKIINDEDSIFGSGMTFAIILFNMKIGINARMANWMELYISDIDSGEVENNWDKKEDDDEGGAPPTINVESITIIL